MTELSNLIATKQRWLDAYQPYALTLCLAVLDSGETDDLGDPDNVRRHHMTVRARQSGDIKIIATEKSDNFVPSLNCFAETRRLIVKAGKYQPAYLTFTNDPNLADAQHNIFVPGIWMDYADQVIKEYEDKQDKIKQEIESVEIAKMKSELLINVAGYGSQYEDKKESEVDF